VNYLDCILDQLRFIKSKREIAVMREATDIADPSILRAMNAAIPGLLSNATTVATDRSGPAENG